MSPEVQSIEHSKSLDQKCQAGAELVKTGIDFALSKPMLQGGTGLDEDVCRLVNVSTELSRKLGFRVLDPACEGSLEVYCGACQMGKGILRMVSPLHYGGSNSSELNALTNADHPIHAMGESLLKASLTELKNRIGDDAQNLFSPLYRQWSNALSEA